MSTEKLDGATFLSTVDAKMLALQRLREAVVQAIAVGALSSAGDAEAIAPAGSRDSSVPTDLPEGAFRNKSVPACIELYLSTVGMKKKTNKEIVEALTDGGVETTSDTLENTVASALFKLKKVGKVLRFKDGWGLATNYPAHIRGAAATTPSSPTTAKKSRRKARSAAKKNPSSGASAKPNAAAAAEGAQQSGSAQARIVELLRSKPQAEFSRDEVASALPDIKGNTVTLILGRLTDVRRKVAERTPSGNYRIINSNGHQPPTWQG